MNQTIVLDKHEMVVDRDHYEDLVEELNRYKAESLLKSMQKGKIKNSPRNLARIAELMGLNELSEVLLKTQTKETK